MTPPPRQQASNKIQISNSSSINSVINSTALRTFGCLSQGMRGLQVMCEHIAGMC